jgi:hypothetical protein
MPMASTVESITIQYKDGSYESVKLGAVKFTEDEKKALVKSYPSKYDGVTTITDEDVKAVRVGVAPSYDPSYKEQAELKAKSELQQQENQKRVDEAKKQADKVVSDKVNAPASKPVVEKGK